MTAQPPADPDPPETDPGAAVNPVSAAAAPAKRPRQLNAWHIVISSLAGIALVLLAGLIAYPFTHPNGSAQWSDLIRSIVLAVAAMGAVPAAFVAFRKQQTTEADHQLEQNKLALDQAKETNRQKELAEANARRIEEIDAANERADAKAFSDRFTVVANQIGSDKAPVRLAGVYAMAQLADEWGRVDPPQRQTCIDVLCAYLRMPWPAAKLHDSPDGRATAPSEDPATTQQKLDLRRIRDEDTRVRETILRVIAAHVHMDRTGDHWHNNNFDVTGAELPDVQLDDSQFCGNFTASNATFTGDASFDNAIFTAHAIFSRTTFTAETRFTGSTFAGDAWFHEAKFAGAACFDSAKFESRVRFSRAEFSEEAWFSDTTFAPYARLSEATFTGPAWFGNATFSQDAVFTGATFATIGSFDGTSFTGTVHFDRATFSQDAVFTGATFATIGWFDGTTVLGQVTRPDGSIAPATDEPRTLGPDLGFPESGPPAVS